MYKLKLFNSLKLKYFKHLQKYDADGSLKADISAKEPKLYKGSVESKDAIAMNQYNYEVQDYLQPTLTPVSDLMINRAKNIKETSLYIKEQMKSIKGSEVQELINILNGFNNAYAGYLSKSVLVGGAVRDIIRGVKPHDYDFATNIPYEDLENKFKSMGWDCKEAGKSFKVLYVSKNDQMFEIANFRCDGEYKEGKPINVSIGSMEDDAWRRDFTINAIMVDLMTFEVHDLTEQGIDDLMGNVLRFIGNAQERIDEDANRVFRFYRFVGKGYDPEAKSLVAVRRNFNCAIKVVKAERIRLEFEKMGGLI